MSGGDGFLKNSIPASAIEAEFSLAGRLTGRFRCHRQRANRSAAAHPHRRSARWRFKASASWPSLFDPDPVKLELSAGLKFSLGPLVAVVERMGATGAFKLPAERERERGTGPVRAWLQAARRRGLSHRRGRGARRRLPVLRLREGRIRGRAAAEHARDGVDHGDRAHHDANAGRLGAASACWSSSRVEFMPGIQLGLGFTLIGLGGLLGLNRTMLLEPLMLGVERARSTRSCSRRATSSPTRRESSATCAPIFPPYVGKFLIGPMAKLGWGTPTLVSVSLGVIIEIPGQHRDHRRPASGAARRPTRR